MASIHEMTYVPDEWTPFYGDYKKCVQDIELQDGTVLYKCYPNAGVFLIFGSKHAPVPVTNVKAVRKHKLVL